VSCHLERKNDKVSGVAEYANPGITSFRGAAWNVGDLPRCHALQTVYITDEWFTPYPRIDELHVQQLPQPQQAHASDLKSLYQNQCFFQIFLCIPRPRE